jgi:hypothetical protein
LASYCFRIAFVTAHTHLFFSILTHAKIDAAVQ